MDTKEEGNGMNWKIGINIHTPLYVECVNHKDLLYSMGNYTQYFVITCKGKESEKE